MDTTDILDRLGNDPSLYLREIDLRRNRAFLVPMQEADYRASAFLGGPRLVTSGGSEHGVALDALVERCATPQGAMHFLFHVGHCGSTLLARLLGELPGLFCLREPRPVMSLAWYARQVGTPGFRLSPAAWRDHLHAVLSLLSRTWRSGDVALVKPNSHSNNVMVEALDWAGDGRAVLLQTRLETWLATVLKPAKRAEIEHFAGLRVADLGRMLGTALADPQQPHARAGVIWLAQLLEFDTLMARPERARRCLRVDFDDFLNETEAALARVAGHFGLDLDRETGQRALHRVRGEHAKHPGRRYGAAERQRELDASRRRHRDEIAAARDYAARLCREHPALERAAGAWI